MCIQFGGDVNLLIFSLSIINSEFPRWRASDEYIGFVVEVLYRYIKRPSVSLTGQSRKPNVLQEGSHPFCHRRFCALRQVCGPHFERHQSIQVNCIGSGSCERLETRIRIAMSWRPGLRIGRTYRRAPTQPATQYQAWQRHYIHLPVRPVNAGRWLGVAPPFNRLPSPDMSNLQMPCFLDDPIQGCAYGERKISVPIELCSPGLEDVVLGYGA